MAKPVEFALFQQGGKMAIFAMWDEHYFDRNGLAWIREKEGNDDSALIDDRIRQLEALAMRMGL